MDQGPFATTNMAAYIQLLSFLRQRGFCLSFENEPETLADILRECSGEYLTEGLQSLSTLPSSSVDFCFSNAVLEHIQKADFPKLVSEMFRILKPSGVSVHRVDLRDHLGGGLNSLRFSEARWEDALFRNSGFYTNRIRLSEMMFVFEQTGFECVFPRVLRWQKLPISRTRLDISFHNFLDVDPSVSGFDVVLKCKG